MIEAQTRGEVVWEPAANARQTSRLGQYLTWLAETGRLDTDSYRELWRWSTTALDEFWSSIADYFALQIEGAGPALREATMPAQWFPGAHVSYPEHALRSVSAAPAVIGISQTRSRTELGGDGLRDQVARCRAGLRRLGVGRGDTVAAYLPHIPEAIIAFLATSSLGAVWVSCPPEFGVKAVVDRFSQLDPVILIAVDGVRYGAKDIDRGQQIATIQAEVPTITTVVSVPYLRDGIPGAMSWETLLSASAPLQFERVPFNHPLYVLFSSGTTGLPKAIVHSHGGILLEHYKMLGLMNDIRAGDKFFWYSTTGWMMWNYAVSALLLTATVVCFDGNPAWPSLDTLWDLAETERITYFGTSASFIMGCRAAGLNPSTDHDLSSLRGVGSTGSSLPADGFRWIAQHVSRTALLNSASGGTDICSAFVGATPLTQVRAGEIPAPMLGAAIAALDPAGNPVIGQPGELVVLAPMPSMPVGFAGDVDGARMRAAYYDQNPGLWTHGDWITIFADGASVISGRSDSTLNRGGVRLGTSDFYAVVEEIPGVVDSLVVHLEDPGGGAGRLILFISDGRIETGAPCDHRADLRETIRRRLRDELSPRHVPDDVVFLAVLPRTLSGKKLEMPVKRILRGQPVDEVASRDSLGEPDALDAIARWAHANLGGSTESPRRRSTAP